MSTVTGNNPNGIGVNGVSDTDTGVLGQSNRGSGVFGQSNTGVGVFATSQTFKAVEGICEGAGVAGVVGVGKGPGSIGVLGQGTVAGRFEGDLVVTGQFEGDLVVTGDVKLTGSDCAEEFNIQSDNADDVDVQSHSVEPGTVMVINQSGNLEESHQPYDKKVAGVISGAGTYKPAIILGKKDNTENKNRRMPIALMGRVYCKVDANHSSIEIGDLLTTSPTRGHAMKAEDPFQAFGSVLGKALGSIKEGLGMIPVLVALQ